MRVPTVCLQGEDVSMGIWMAAVGPQKYQVRVEERRRKRFHLFFHIHSFARLGRGHFLSLSDVLRSLNAER